MTEDALYREPALARFYDLDNGWTEDRSCCLGLARGCRSALDLGCGTGDLAIRIAAETGAEVTGADPAAAMLALARAKPGADRVTWVQSPAQRLDLAQSFDLIVMTGHAFQTLLTPADRGAALAAVARHLAPDGRFVFDSRNPAPREWRDWQPEASRRVIDDPVFGPVAAWDEAACDEATRVVTYTTHYRVAADWRHFQADARIAFPPFTELQRAIAAAGLRVETWLGDWTGAPLRSGSPEFIPICRPA